MTIGAANMLTFSDEGAIAANSDATAVRSIVNNMAQKPANALVLGAGGAARAILWALRQVGVETVMIANRTRARADAIAPLAGARVIDWRERNEALAAADLTINTTSLGMSGHPPLDLDHHRLRTGATVMDIVYAPLETPFLAAAKARGLRTIDGLEMLMGQARPGYLAWLGEKAEIDDALRAILVTELEKRNER